MFKLDTSPTFNRTVTVNRPEGDGFATETFNATFRILAISEEEKFDLELSADSTLFLRAIIVSFDDIAGDDGKPIAYSDALRERVLDLPYARGALARAYYAGAKGARAGN